VRTAQIFRLSMAHPGDLSELDRLIAGGTVRAAEVVAIIGKTEGNGGVNDFTRGYFTQTLMALLARHLNKPAEQLIREIPCVLSGGTEGVMSPHYSVFCAGEVGSLAGRGIFARDRHRLQRAGAGRECRSARAMSTASPTRFRAAIINAGIERLDDVHFVQVKCPSVTVARAAAAIAAGKTPITNDPNKSMAFARARRAHSGWLLRSTN